MTLRHDIWGAGAPAEPSDPYSMLGLQRPAGGARAPGEPATAAAPAAGRESPPGSPSGHPIRNQAADARIDAPEAGAAAGESGEPGAEGDPAPAARSASTDAGGDEAEADREGSGASRHLHVKHAGPDFADDDAGIAAFDFSAATELDAALAQSVRSVHERLARRIASTLSIELGTEVWVQVSSVSAMRASSYRQTIADSVLFADIVLQPTGVRALLECGAGVTFALVERLLGGLGAFDTRPRLMTAIETVVSRRFVDGWGKHLATVMDGTQHEIRALHGDPDLLRIGEATDELVHVGLELGFEGGSAPFSLAYRFGDWRRPETAPPEASTVHRDQVARSLGHAAVELRVELGQASLTLGEIADMRPGDVIRLSRHADRDVDVRIDRSVRFTAEPGQLGGRRAVRIKRVVEESN